MLTLRNKSRLVVAVALLAAAGGSFGGCVEKVERNGSCVALEADEAAPLDCAVDGLGNAIAVREGVPALGAYACTGTARPDDGAVMREGVPAGRICTQRAWGDAEGRRGYCCTEYDTDCAYNPAADCTSDKYGYECRGSLRPETYNPTIYCDQATKDGDLLNYCCGNSPDMSGSCVATAGCGDYLTAWTCKNPEDTPRSQELLASKSRADTFYMTCSIPKTNTNGTFFYCCFTPGVIREGGTCSPHTAVPNCDVPDEIDPVTNLPKRTFKFGWACLGPDTPTEDFPAMQNCSAGVSGISAEGYPATLYCCDFVPPEGY
jgi:hypothetical protein